VLQHNLLKRSIRSFARALWLSKLPGKADHWQLLARVAIENSGVGLKFLEAKDLLFPGDFCIGHKLVRNQVT
jgi:hypothetical protein